MQIVRWFIDPHSAYLFDVVYDSTTPNTSGPNITTRIEYIDPDNILFDYISDETTNVNSA